MGQVIDFAATIDARRAAAQIAAVEAAIKQRADVRREELRAAAREAGAGLAGEIVADALANIAETEEERARASRFMPAYCDPENERRGSKHEATRSLDITEIAKRIRADIKALALDPAYKFSVKISRYSGGQSLDVRVQAVPAGFRYYSEAAAAWCKQFPNSEHRMPMAWREAQSDELRDLMAKLGAIHASYNRSNTDSMSDYFDVRYYGDVSLDWRISDTLKKADVAAARDDYWHKDSAR